MILEQGQYTPSLSSLQLSDHFIAIPNNGGFDIYDLILDKRTLQVIGKCISFAITSPTVLVLQQGRLVLYSLTTSKAIALFQHNLNISIATVSANGKRVAALDEMGSLIVWDRETSKEILKLDNLSDQVTQLMLSNRGKLLITFHNNQIKFWSVDEKRLKYVVPVASKKLVAYLSANEKTFLLVDKITGKSEVWDLQEQQSKPLGKVVGSGIVELFVSSNGNLAIINGVIWDLNSAKALTKASLGYGTLLKEDKVILATVNGFEVWDIKKNSLLATIRNYEFGWLIYTPEVFFDGSEESKKLLSWQLTEKPFLQVSNEKLEERFYIPNLLSKIAK